MMLYKRLREIDVPEMMASIIAQTPGKPWGYYRDMSRQLWDEARHAMMGEVGFVALGVDWTKAKITFNWSYRLNTECTPMERHGVLYFIEQGLMPKTGKRYEFETGQASGLPLIATLQDFDWADEVLHSQIGRQWYVPEFGNLQGVARLRRRRVVEDPEQLGDGEGEGTDEARELVARRLRAGLRRGGRRTRPGGAGVRRNVRGEACGSEGRWRRDEWVKLKSPGRRRSFEFLCIRILAE